MRWFVGTAGVFIWTGLLVGSVSAQRSNIDASLREAIGEIDKRPVEQAIEGPEKQHGTTDQHREAGPYKRKRSIDKVAPEPQHNRADEQHDEGVDARRRTGQQVLGDPDQKDR